MAPQMQVSDTFEDPQRQRLALAGVRFLAACTYFVHVVSSSYKIHALLTASSSLLNFILKTQGWLGMVLMGCGITQAILKLHKNGCAQEAERLDALSEQLER